MKNQGSRSNMHFSVILRVIGYCNGIQWSRWSRHYVSWFILMVHLMRFFMRFGVNLLGAFLLWVPVRNERCD